MMTIPDPAQSRWFTSPRLLLILFLALLVVALVPLTVARIMPLADYPNHIARIYILQHAAQSPVLSRYYVPFIHFQPNLAFDLAVLWLGKIFPLWTAGSVFAAASFVTIVSGVVALNRALHRQWSLWPCLAFLLLYNRLFLWGFIGYLFTLGVALWGIAAWHAFRNKSMGVRLVVGAAFAFAVYIGHLFAFGFYGLVLAALVGHLAWEKWRDDRPLVLREAVIAFVPFIVPIAIFFFVSPTGQAGQSTFWSGLTRSVTAPFNIVQNYNMSVDALTFVVFAALFAFLFLRRRLQVSIASLVAFCVLALVQLAMPDKLFSSYSADHRLPIAIALFAIAVSQPRIRSEFWLRLGVVALISLFLARMAIIVNVWQRADARYQPYEQALAKLPVGARISTVVVNGGATWLPAIPVFEIGCLAILSRDAFVANLFAYPKDAGQSVAFTPAYVPVQTAATYHIFAPMDFDLMRSPAGSKFGFRPMRAAEILYFDYYLVINPKEYGLPLPPNVHLEQRGPDFNIYRVDHTHSNTGI